MTTLGSRTGTHQLGKGAVYQLWKRAARYNHTFLPLSQWSGLRSLQGELAVWRPSKVSRNNSNRLREPALKTITGVLLFSHWETSSGLSGLLRGFFSVSLSTNSLIPKVLVRILLLIQVTWLKKGHPKIESTQRNDMNVVPKRRACHLLNHRQSGAAVRSR